MFHFPSDESLPSRIAGRCSFDLWASRGIGISKTAGTFALFDFFVILVNRRLLRAMLYCSCRYSINWLPPKACRRLFSLRSSNTKSKRLKRRRKGARGTRKNTTKKKLSDQQQPKKVAGVSLLLRPRPKGQIRVSLSTRTFSTR